MRTPLHNRTGLYLSSLSMTNTMTFEQKAALDRFIKNRIKCGRVRSSGRSSSAASSTSASRLRRCMCFPQPIYLHDISYLSDLNCDASGSTEPYSSPELPRQPWCEQRSRSAWQHSGMWSIRYLQYQIPLDHSRMDEP